ncbi:MAG: Cobalt/magnesium transport protein CorA [Phycisphaerae bacterium]|nr:Cobalt/magnesium transport protein CorA [Phycisphaerae bacterium]
MSKRRGSRHWRRVPSVRVGEAPGTLRVDESWPKPKIRVMAWSAEKLVEADVSDPAGLSDFLGQWPVVWVNVDGLGDAAMLQGLGDLFKLHPLALEDVVNVPQRPKLELYDRNSCLVLSRMVRESDGLGSEQLSLFIGDGVVLTFQERSGDCFDPIRARIRAQGSRLRQLGADYLAYALMDAVIDAYYPVIETFGERLEAMETAILARPTRDAIRHIHRARRDLLVLRRALWPQRDVLNALIRDEMPQIAPETRVYLRDCYDHLVQIMDLIETDRELVSGLLDAYMSSVSNRMNDVMKVLTIIATIFIPLGFIAGLYGMNFSPENSPYNMPELRWRFGYEYALGLMAAIAAVMLGVFWRLGWLGGGTRIVGPPDEEDADPSADRNAKEP